MEFRSDFEIVEMFESVDSRVNHSFKLMLGRNIERVLEVLGQEIIRDVDYIILDGQIPFEELDQFLYVSEEYHTAHTQVHDVCDDIIDHVCRNLGRKLSETKDKKNRFNNRRGLLRISQTFCDGVESLMLDAKTVRNTLVNSMDRYFAQNFYLRIWFAIKNNPELRKYEGMLRELLGTLDRQFLNGTGLNCPGVVGISLFNNFRVTLQKHSDLFARLLETQDDTDEVQLKNVCDEIFSEARDLSAFRSISHITKEVEGMKIHLYGSSEEDETRSGALCRVKISFDNNTNFIETVESSGSPNPVLRMVTSNDSFDFILNRYSGELFLGSSQISLDRQVGRDIADDFIGETELYKLKKIILEFLLDYLRSQPEDIERVEVPIVNQERIDTKKSVVETLENDINEGIDYEYVPYEPVVDNLIESEKQDLIIQDVVMNGSFDEFLCIRTIERITGIPANLKRGKGSHVVLEGANGRKFPVPSHKGKDIALPILKKCLKKLNIPYSRFIDEY